MTKPPPPRILVVDDEPINIELIADIFSEGHEVLFAMTGEKALEIATAELPDVILLDVMMPGIDGYEVCRRLKEQPATSRIPIIFITSLDDVGSETRGLELGAMDYVTKPFSPAVVKMRVKNMIGLKQACDRNLTELSRTCEQLNNLTVIDDLTGLSNRSHFDRLLAKEHARLIRSGAKLSLILLDIDHFTAFNHAYGPISGDSCLRQVARVIDDVIVRAADTAARYDGEKFACILPETGLEGALVIAEKIRRGILLRAIPHKESMTAGYVTASFGVVTVQCAAKKSVAFILTQAETQLGKAKSTGRNRISYDQID
ncbi:MAG: diguanylate cyclase [Magnetococcales bacterium]|nr:diguanylate cyclase [Magnetococcales bacterium]